MNENLPTYLQNFTCYSLRVQFMATRDASIQGKWAHLPSYALGDALMHSPKYSYLYHTLFKPLKETKTDVPARIIIRADGEKRNSFSKNEILNLYITIVSNQVEEVRDFIGFLPEWQEFHFFAQNDLKYHSAYMLHPQTNEFESVVKSAFLPLDASFFNKKLIQWKNALEIRFLTPTTYFKDHVMTNEIGYEDLIERIRIRVYHLYCNFLTHKWIPNVPLPTPAAGGRMHSVTLLNRITFPEKALIKNNKQDLSGVKGFVCYAVPYSYEEDFLLTLAHHIHVGNNTIRGNGQISAVPCEEPFFRDFIHSLSSVGISRSKLDSLSSLTYVPAPYRAVNIPKTDGSFRELHIPSPEDLTLQKTMGATLFQALDKLSLPQNFAYRKGKGAVEAIRLVKKWKSAYAATHYVIRCDIDDFFDTIPTEKLVSKLYKTISDPFVCFIISMWIRSGYVNDHQSYARKKKGIPQGCPVSPMLANLYLVDLDRFIEQKITPLFVRYADDILLLIPKEEKAIRVLQMLTDYLYTRLELQLNQEFTVSSLSHNFTFLGIAFGADETLAMSHNKKDRLTDKIRQSLWINEADDFSKLRENVQGMKNYYGKLLPETEKEKIDDVLVTVYTAFLKEKTHAAMLVPTAAKLSEVGFLTSKYTDAKWAKHVKIAQKPLQNKPLSESSALQLQYKRHLENKAEMCELVVSQTGSFIGISKNNVQVKYAGEVLISRPINTLKQISILAEGVNISSYVTKYCTGKDVQIVYYNPRGEAYATIQHPAKILSANMEAQIQMTDHRKKLFITELVKNKVTNQQKLLKYYKKYYKSRYPLVARTLEECIRSLDEEIPRMPQEETYPQQRESLFLWEARCALTYWDAFRAILSQTPYPFQIREHRNATGIVNQLLNYGYALLQSKVMRTLQTWQLSPNISYLHTTADGEPSLCFDLMEQYRAFVVDRSVIALITKGEKISQEQNTGLLSLDTRKKLIAKINERWFAIEKYKGKDYLLSDVTHKLMEHFLNFCKNKNNKPGFYKPKW